MVSGQASLVGRGPRAEGAVCIGAEAPSVQALKFQGSTKSKAPSVPIAFYRLSVGGGRGNAEWRVRSAEFPGGQNEIVCLCSASLAFLWGRRLQRFKVPGLKFKVRGLGVVGWRRDVRRGGACAPRDEKGKGNVRALRQQAPYRVRWIRRAKT